MAGYEERMFQLGLEALAEQERGVAQIRSRGTGLLAAGAVVPSLLAHAVFSGVHHEGAVRPVASVVGIAGGVALLVLTLVLLAPYEMAFSLDATHTYRWLWDAGLLSQPGSEQPGVDLALADALADLRQANRRIVHQLAWTLRFDLLALAVEASGFAVAAAVAS